MMKQIGYWLLLSAALVFTDASAQQFVYPAKGQTPEKQKSDESACYGWAVQQTGFDPNAAAEQSGKQQQQAASSQQQAAFAKARAACREGRGYTVK